MRAARARKKSTRNFTGGASRKQAPVTKKSRSYAWVNRLLIFLAVGVVVALAGKAYIAVNAIPVEHIIVSGKLQHTNTAALEKIIRPTLAGGFLSADLDRVRTQLESLPWIYEVSVRRRWPSSLEVHVVEQLPIARWGDEGFLNHEGQVFQSIGKQGDQWSDLPLLRGPDGAAVQLITVYQKMREILSPHNLLIETLAVDGRGQVEMSLRSGVILVLGGRDLVGRLRRFVEIYNTDLAGDERQLSRVDLRYENGLAVAYKEIPQVAGI